MTAKEFKKFIIGFNEAIEKFKKEKATFISDVTEFMKDKGIPVRVLFFADKFGLDIMENRVNFRDVPRKIPLDVLSDFCKEFDCEFEYTTCNGYRWIFSFDGLDMRS